jgi:hypothetical protein
VLLVLEDVAGPVLTDALGLAVFDEEDVFVPAPGPVFVWLVVLVWLTVLDALLKPLFASASCRVRTDADWSTSLCATGAPGPGGGVSVAVAVAVLDCVADVVEPLVALAAPALTVALAGSTFDDVEVLLEGAGEVLVCVVSLLCVMSLNASLNPLLESASCEVRTLVRWSTSLVAEGPSVAKAVAPRASTTAATPAAATSGFVRCFTNYLPGERSLRFVARLSTTNEAEIEGQEAAKTATVSRQSQETRASRFRRSILGRDSARPHVHRRAGTPRHGR